MPQEVDWAPFLFGPMPYSLWWFIGAAMLVLLCVGWVVGVLVWTLPIETLRRFPVVRDVAYRVLRYKFSRSLETVARRHREGSIDTRAAFHEISRLFRLFLTYRTGYAAKEMTATDVAVSPLAAAALPVLSLTYPGQFDTADPRTVDTAVRTARQAVAQWR